MTESAAGCRSTKTDEQQISAEVIGDCLRAAVLSPADQRARVEQSSSLDRCTCRNCYFELGALQMQ